MTLTVWIIIGAFLVAQPDGSTTKIVQPAKFVFESEKDCLTNLNEEQKPTLDSNVEAGVITAYSVQCSKVEVNDVVAATVKKPKELPVAKPKSK